MEKSKSGSLDVNQYPSFTGKLTTKPGIWQLPMTQQGAGDSYNRPDPNALENHAIALARLACRKLLNSVIDTYEPAKYACLGTLDGRLLAATGEAWDCSHEELCAFTSSFFALGDAFAKRSMGSTGNYSVVAMEQGAIVISMVKTRTRTYALSLGADKTHVLAMTLRRTLDLGCRLAVILEKMSFWDE